MPLPSLQHRPYTSPRVLPQGTALRPCLGMDTSNTPTCESHCFLSHGGAHSLIRPHCGNNLPPTGASQAPWWCPSSHAVLARTNSCHVLEAQHLPPLLSICGSQLCLPLQPNDFRGLWGKPHHLCIVTSGCQGVLNAGKEGKGSGLAKAESSGCHQGALPATVAPDKAALSLPSQPVSGSPFPGVPQTQVPCTGVVAPPSEWLMLWKLFLPILSKIPTLGRSELRSSPSP